MSLEKISQIEQVLHSLKSQRDYIDQLKLAMQLSSSSSSSSSSARAIPAVGHNYDPHTNPPEIEKLINDGTLTAVTTPTTTKTSYPNTGTVLLTYPGHGLLDTEDCQIFSANALALKDCYENVLLSIALSRQGDSVAVQIHLPGVGTHTVDTATASSSSITDIHIDPTTSTTTTTTATANSVVDDIASVPTDGGKHVPGATTPVGLLPSHHPDVDNVSYQLGAHSHTHSQSQYRTLSDYLNIVEIPLQINSSTCTDKGHNSEGSYASYLINQLSEQLLILPKVSHTL